jgi:2-keto-4-pentenoate hydratase/2-oxohepta-3-ene-1,7-dioic acid hydratase in catechol pathway
MRIANAIHGTDHKMVAALDASHCVDLTAAIRALGRGHFTSLDEMLRAGKFETDLLNDATAYGRSHGLVVDYSALRVIAPLDRPGQIIALARNYTAHAQESTLPPPTEPIFFAKSNTSVIGPEEPIVLPPNLGRIEPEIELAVIIGRRASHVRRANAADYIAGYTILNDVSAQELQAKEILEGYPLFRCKSLQTFTPMGPWVLTVDEAGVEPNVEMRLKVSGDLRVTAHTRGLTFGIAELVEYISGFVLLLPGDVITTGCPKAAGAIVPGDQLELEIDGIGVLRNPVHAGTEPCPA